MSADDDNDNSPDAENNAVTSPRSTHKTSQCHISRYRSWCHSSRWVQMIAAIGRLIAQISGWLGLRVSSHLALFCVHQTNQENSWNEWLCYDGGNMNTATITFNIISTIILIIIKQTAISQAVYHNKLLVTNLWCRSLPAAAVWCVQAVQICPSNLPCLASHACTSPVSVSTSTHGYFLYLPPSAGETQKSLGSPAEVAKAVVYRPDYLL